MKLELIKELTLKAQQQMTGTGSLEFCEKYTELVIEECLRICSTVEQWSGVLHQPEREVACKELADRIKYRFYGDSKNEM